MSAIIFYFHVHQPLRIKRYPVFSIGNDHNYFIDNDSENVNIKVLNKVAHKCYLPMNALLLKLLKKYPEFYVSFSISGIILEQLELFTPDVLKSFKKLVKTGQVELVAETYHHSLSSIYSINEFNYQVKKQMAKLYELFYVKPNVFRNTELIYSNQIAEMVANLGFRGMLAEGVDRYLSWRKPDFLYTAYALPKFLLMLKNYRLSDDIAFRFSQQSWSEHPLTAEKYKFWLDRNAINSQLTNIFMDYETFGEHQWDECGIFAFFEKLIELIAKDKKYCFTTPSQAIKMYKPSDIYDVPEITSWADTERDISAWRSNAIQWDSLRAIYNLEPKVLATKNQGIIDDWRKLQTSDHFYYMCTKWWHDGDVHAYFSPMDSPFDAYNRFNNALADLQWRLDNN